MNTAMNEKFQDTAGSWEAGTAENLNGRCDGKLMRLCVESVFEEYDDELADPDDPQGEPQWVKFYGLALHHTAEGHDIVPACCLTGCRQTVRLDYPLGVQLQQALQAEPAKFVRGRYLADTFHRQPDEALPTLHRRGEWGTFDAEASLAVDERGMLLVIVNHDIPFELCL